MNANDEIPSLVRTVRELMGFTQEKLAAKLGVTFPTINRWENGHSRPSPLAVIRIKELLDSLGAGGRGIYQELVSRDWSTRERRFPGYRQVIYMDEWPVLDQGTD